MTVFRDNLEIITAEPDDVSINGRGSGGGSIFVANVCLPFTAAFTGDGKRPVSCVSIQLESFFRLKEFVI